MVGSISSLPAELSELSALFARDPAWAAYLIADLAPPYAAHSTWFADVELGAVVLLYHAFEVPVLTVLGPSEACAPLWREALAAVPTAEQVFAVCLPEHRAFVDASIEFEDADAMFRMRLEGDPAPQGPTETLGLTDLKALRALYENGIASGEAPNFFDPSMLAGGCYRGLRDQAGALASVAGTHVVAGDVAAIGGVYTRRDARGRGLGRRVTAAVAHDLRARGIRTIVLNVRQGNLPAVHIYEQLGFVVHGAFDEGFARRR